MLNPLGRPTSGRPGSAAGPPTLLSALLRTVSIYLDDLDSEDEGDWQLS